MEGGSTNTTSCMMAFGDDGNGLCPMTMMPLMTLHHHHHNNNHRQVNVVESSSLFLPLTLPTNNQEQNHNSSSGSSMILDDHNNDNNNNSSATAAGCYFMDNNDGSSSNSVKAKIMAHPHYHRLLAAYVNCQKVMKVPNTDTKIKSKTMHSNENSTCYIVCL